MHFFPASVSAYHYRHSRPQRAIDNLFSHLARRPCTAKVTAEGVWVLQPGGSSHVRASLGHTPATRMEHNLRCEREKNRREEQCTDRSAMRWVLIAQWTFRHQQSRKEAKETVVKCWSCTVQLYFSYSSSFEGTHLCCMWLAMAIVPQPVATTAFVCKCL